MNVTPAWYLLLSSALFGLGLSGILVRRNPLVMLMCVELMLNAVNLSFFALGRILNDAAANTAVLFVLVVAAAEVVVGLAMIVALSRKRAGATADDLTVLRG